MAKRLIARKGSGRSSEVYAVDAVPDSPQGEVDWEDVTPTNDGPGGSAFAHLTEDTDAGSIFSDLLITASPDGTFDGPYGFLDPSGLIGSHVAAGNLAIQVHALGENQDRLHVLGDGSLHWGDGAGSPDTSLQRAANGGLLVADPDDDGFYVAAEVDHSTSYVWLGGDGTVAIVNATAQQRNIIVDADGDLAILGVGKIAIQP